MPRLNVKFGSLPLYAIDLLIFITLIYSTKIKPNHNHQRPFGKIIVWILVFAVLGELAAIYYSGAILSPVYLVIRNILAISLFFSTGNIIQSEDDLLVIFKAALLGIGISSVLMIMTSLPFTRSLVVNTLFSISYLEPAAEQTVRMYSAQATEEVGVRGKSLIGVSILSGAFINIMWPILGLLLRWPQSIGNWRNIALIGTLLAPMAVVMSYSRGAIIGSILVVCGVLFFGSSRNRQGIIVAVLVAVSLFSFVGWDSNIFFFDRLETRGKAMIEKPYEDGREAERINSYIEPFEHVINHPQFFVIGEGTSIGKTGVAAEIDGKANHSVFAIAYYSYGMIATFLYMILVMSGFHYTLKQIAARKKLNDISLLYAQALFAAQLGMLPWFMFGHAAVSQPRGAMMFFLLFGMVAALRNFPTTISTHVETVSTQKGESFGLRIKRHSTWD